MSTTTVAFPFSLVAIDLDGTLLTSKKQVTNNTVNILRNLHLNGVHIVLASGRMTEKMLLLYREELKIDSSYVIGYNGAKCLRITTPTSHEQIFHFPVTTTIYDPLFKYCENLLLIFYYKGRCIGLEKHRDSQLLTVFADITGNPTWEFVETLDEVREMEITNALVITNNEEQADGILRDFRQLFAKEPVHLVKTECATTVHHQYYVEILNPNATKGKALEQLCEILNLNSQQVIAFGDGENDREMIAFAGRGVCMANACEGLKSEAEYVSQYSNNEEGVYKELQNILEGASRVE
jgi:Cof subfamily protein (haloacid dehalogenase superfamily)